MGHLRGPLGVHSVVHSHKTCVKGGKVPSLRPVTRIALVRGDFLLSERAHAPLPLGQDEAVNSALFTAPGFSTAGTWGGGCSYSRFLSNVQYPLRQSEKYCLRFTRYDFLFASNPYTRERD